ncbi:MAG: hypothetical protein U1F87_18325 [Kiritimatiellia bacterium]
MRWSCRDLDCVSESIRNWWRVSASSGSPCRAEGARSASFQSSSSLARAAKSSLLKSSGARSSRTGSASEAIAPGSTSSRSVSLGTSSSTGLAWISCSMIPCNSSMVACKTSSPWRNWGARTMVWLWVCD